MRLFCAVDMLLSLTVPRFQYLQPSAGESRLGQEGDGSGGYGRHQYPAGPRRAGDWGVCVCARVSSRFQRTTAPLSASPRLRRSRKTCLTSPSWTRRGTRPSRRRPTCSWASSACSAIRTSSGLSTPWRDTMQSRARYAEARPGGLPSNPPLPPVSFPLSPPLPGLMRGDEEVAGIAGPLREKEAVQVVRSALLHRFPLWARCAKLPRFPGCKPLLLFN